MTFPIALKQTAKFTKMSLRQKPQSHEKCLGKLLQWLAGHSLETPVIVNHISLMGSWEHQNLPDHSISHVKEGFWCKDIGMSTWLITEEWRGKGSGYILGWEKGSCCIPHRRNQSKAYLILWWGSCMRWAGIAPEGGGSPEALWR